MGEPWTTHATLSRSCVPMATSVLFLARFWCSLSCKSMKEA